MATFQECPAARPDSRARTLKPQAASEEISQCGRCATWRLCVSGRHVIRSRLNERAEPERNDQRVGRSMIQRSVVRRARRFQDGGRGRDRSHGTACRDALLSFAAAARRWLTLGTAVSCLRAHRGANDSRGSERENAHPHQKRCHQTAKHVNSPGSTPEGPADRVGYRKARVNSAS